MAKKRGGVHKPPQSVILEEGKSDRVQQRMRRLVHSPFTVNWEILKADLKDEFLQKLEECVNVLRRKTNEAEEQNKKNVKVFVVLGVNSVTEELEKREADAVVLCDHSNCRAIIQHIPVMAALQDLPCLVIPQSPKICEIFKVAKILAFSIRKNPSFSLTKENECRADEDYIPLPSSFKGVTKAPSVAPLDAVNALREFIREHAAPISLPFLVRRTGVVSSCDHGRKLLPLQTSDVNSGPFVSVRNHRRKARRILRRKRRLEIREKKQQTKEKEKD